MWLLCRVRDRWCGIPLEHVVETMRVLPLEPVADAPFYVRGVAIIRGVATPVVDAALLLGEYEQPHRLVTLRVGERRVALALAEVLGVRDIPASALQDPPPLLSGSEALESLGVLDEKLFMVLKSASLLTR